jgi:hypothetical protein
MGLAKSGRRADFVVFPLHFFIGAILSILASRHRIACAEPVTLLRSKFAIERTMRLISRPLRIFTMDLDPAQPHVLTPVTAQDLKNTVNDPSQRVRSLKN